MAAATKTKATVKGKALLGIRSRKWTEEELKQFAEVLAEYFAFDLETNVICIRCWMPIATPTNKIQSTDVESPPWLAWIMPGNADVV